MEANVQCPPQSQVHLGTLMGGRGWRDVAVGYDAQEGSQTVTKQQGSEFSGLDQNILAVSHQEAQSQDLAPSGNQPSPAAAKGVNTFQVLESLLHCNCA